MEEWIDLLQVPYFFCSLCRYEEDLSDPLSHSTTSLAAVNQKLNDYTAHQSTINQWRDLPLTGKQAQSNPSNWLFNWIIITST